jgi:hypothetical protein
MSPAVEEKSLQLSFSSQKVQQGHINKFGKLKFYKGLGLKMNGSMFWRTSTI